MAKLIKKSKCKFEAGHIVKKNRIIGIPANVWFQLNKLEVALQQHYYLKAQPPACSGPSLDGFERQSALKSVRPYRSAPETPLIDKRVEEAMQFMQEVDEVNNADRINDLIDEYGELIDWCTADKFIEGCAMRPIDTLFLGDPLKLSALDVAASLCIIADPIVIEE